MVAGKADLADALPALLSCDYLTVLEHDCPQENERRDGGNSHPAAPRPCGPPCARNVAGEESGKPRDRPSDQSSPLISGSSSIRAGVCSQPR